MMWWNLAVAAALLSVLIWVYLLLARRGFWRAAPRIETQRLAPPPAWPDVVAVIPARNEAAHVGAALRSLRAQDYPGNLTVILVDDHSEDGTGARAAEVAAEGGHPLQVVTAPPLCPGWTGKLWAVNAGLDMARTVAPAARFVLLTDADIVHPPNVLARLVALAVGGDLDLVSLMVRLHCASFWERLLIPPFVFFFQMLYPFAAVNDPSARTAAAAGGCMLVRRASLDAVGGVEVIRNRLIDDVALAAQLKRAGAGGIWLGLSGATVSRRRYHHLGEIWEMVARTADTQLGHSLGLLATTVLGMAIIYLMPPTALVAGTLTADATLFLLGGLGCVGMVTAYRPTARLYGVGFLWQVSLPVAAALFAGMTVDSAISHRRGVGGRWKGRVFTTT